MSELAPVTEILNAWSEGVEDSADALMDAVYEELHRMAERAIGGERSGHTLQPTALVHEAYLRFSQQRRLRWQSRSHFFAIAAKMMRRVLVDHGRRRLRGKRGGMERPLSLQDVFEPALGLNTDIVELDMALSRLGDFDAAKVSIVELHFFCGFSVKETAEIMEVSTATVSRQWRAAKVWLFHQLHGADPVLSPGDGS